MYKQLRIKRITYIALPQSDIRRTSLIKHCFNLTQVMGMCKKQLDVIDFLSDKIRL